MSSGRRVSLDATSWRLSPKRAGVPVIATFRSRVPYETPHTSWVKADLRDPQAASRALESVETAVLCAGQLSTSAVLRRDPVTSVIETLRIGINLLEAAARLRLKRVVLISSCTGYPELTRPALEPDMAEGDPPAQWSASAGCIGISKSNCAGMSSTSS